MARRLKPAPTVELGRPGEAAGMAAMVAELVRANLADSPSRARVARRARGSIVLLADDRSLGVTLSFREHGVVIDASPAPGLPVLAQYRTPVDGLYLAGSTQHPQGFITFARAYNALQVISDDLGLEAWWRDV